MDTHQHIENKEGIEKLLTTNMELKKELEKEQLLHKMLYKEWKELSEKMSAGQQEAYENSRPRNLFYKYAFYVLLVALIPAFYFLYSNTGNEKITSDIQNVSDSIPANNSLQPIAGTSLKDSLTVKDTQPAIKENQTAKQAVIQQSAIEKPLTEKPAPEKPAPEKSAPEKPVVKTEEKIPVTHDNSLPAPSIAHTPVIEKPLTNDARDSLASEGFSAYFDHRRNPFRKSSARYQAWQQGWNEGKAEAKKVLDKTPSLKN